MFSTQANPRVSEEAKEKAEKKLEGMEEFEE